eukprot:scaffold431_cov103-Cylindrotheca_fusiformis.AAC.12
MMLFHAIPSGSLMLLFLMMSATISLLMSSSTPLFVEAQFDSSSKMNFGQDPKQCPPFQCRRKKKEEQEPVPKWPIQLKSPGCSQGGAIMKMKTDEDEDEEEDVLLSCCDQRNACLQTCGSLTVVCEQAFMACGEQTCAAIDDGSNCTRSLQLQKLLHTISPTYCDDYYRAQKQNCQCVSTENAPQARMEFLTKFYDKYDDNNDSKEIEQKAKSLATKADTSRKMSTLVGKLIMKYYPETITRIKDPQQERMEQMMKDATSSANAGKTKETKNKKETSTEEETEDDDTVEDLGVEEL